MTFTFLRVLGTSGFMGIDLDDSIVILSDCDWFARWRWRSEFICFPPERCDGLCDFLRSGHVAWLCCNVFDMDHMENERRSGQVF